MQWSRYEGPSVNTKHGGAYPPGIVGAWFNSAIAQILWRSSWSHLGGQARRTGGKERTNVILDPI